MDTRRFRRRRVGFTLVELLVAMAVTLILIFALAQAFAIVGETVSEGRATIEMAGTLRGVAHRLQTDLGGVTVAVRPWIDEASGQGYFEYVDGPSTDKDWDLAWDTDVKNEVDEDRDGDGTYDWLQDPPPADSSTPAGDLDDILAFTTRSSAEPFVGVVGGTVYRSTLAEVIWWIQYQDLNGNGVWEAGEQFMIYRRVMLIRPDLGVRLNGRYTNDQSGYQGLKSALASFFNNNDISVNLRWWYTTGVTGNPTHINVRLIANSLADLTRRENRFARVTILSDRNNGVQLAPPPRPSFPPYAAMPSPGFAHPLDVNRRSITSLYRSPKFGSNAGEDVMMANALAFDVQAFDPLAPIRPTTVSGEAIVPNDPAYFPTSWPTSWTAKGPDGPLAPNNWPDDTIGYGAFVDVGYGHRAFPSALSWTPFFGRPHTRSRLRNVPMWGASPSDMYCYCTWSMHYERDNWDQDGDGKGTDNAWGVSGVDDNNDGNVDDIGERGWPGSDDLVDEGTNGFDDPNSSGNYVNGVDDVGERETSPPYPVPLRGIQVKIRVWDPDSRQIRQMTVVSDFVPE